MNEGSDRKDVKLDWEVRIAEAAKRWATKIGGMVKSLIINVVKVIAVIVAINVVMYLGVFYASPSSFYDIYDSSSTTRWLARCDTLEEELAIDIKCWRADDCKMTRKEFATYEKRLAKYELHCGLDDA
jgi:hypothetical protein